MGIISPPPKFGEQWEAPQLCTLQFVLLLGIVVH